MLRPLPDVALQVQALLGKLGQGDPYREGRTPVAKDREARFARVTRVGLGNTSANGGVRMILEGRRLAARIVLRHARAAREEKAGQDQADTYPAESLQRSRARNRWRVQDAALSRCRAHIGFADSGSW